MIVESCIQSSLWSRFKLCANCRSFSHHVSVSFVSDFINCWNEYQMLIYTLKKDYRTKLYMIINAMFEGRLNQKLSASLCVVIVRWYKIYSVCRTGKAFKYLVVQIIKYEWYRSPLKLFPCKKAWKKIVHHMFILIIL